MARWRQTLQKTITSWNDHDSTTQAAALAFYTVFSLAPLLIVVIAVAGTAFGPDAVRGQIVDELQTWMGHDAANFIQGMLRTAARPATNRLAGAIGIATLVFGASGVFVQLQQSLNLIWGVAPKPGAAFTRLLRKRILSFAVIIGIGFLLVVSLLLSAALTAVGDYLEQHFRLSMSLLHLFNIGSSLLVVTLLFGLIYRLLPDADLCWSDVLLGSLVTSALFGIGKAAIGYYLGRSGVASAYGAAGSLVLVISWVYYSALIFLLGAEFTHVHSTLRRGGKVPVASGAIPVPPGTTPAAATAALEKAPRPDPPAPPPTPDAAVATPADPAIAAPADPAAAAAAGPATPRRPW